MKRRASWNWKLNKPLVHGPVGTPLLVDFEDSSCPTCGYHVCKGHFLGFEGAEPPPVGNDMTPGWFRNPVEDCYEHVSGTSVSIDDIEDSPLGLHGVLAFALGWRLDVGDWCLPGAPNGMIAFQLGAAWHAYGPNGSRGPAFDTLTQAIAWCRGGK